MNMKENLELSYSIFLHVAYGGIVILSFQNSDFSYGTLQK